MRNSSIQRPAPGGDGDLAGMWLFLATELLFFGGLFYLWMVLRRWHPAGFARPRAIPTC